MARGRWSEATHVIDKTIPQSSVIGMVFEHQEQGCKVVRGHGVGFAQHDPFSWEVEWRDFVFEKKLGVAASHFDSSMNEWLQTSTPDERERFVDAVFSVLAASGETTFGGVKRNWRLAVPKVLLAVAMLAPEDRQFVQRAILDIWHTVMPDLPLADLRRLIGNGASGLKALIAPKQE